MSKLEIALFCHLLGALLLVAGIVVAGVAFEAARRRHRPGEIALLLAMTRIGVLFVVVGALAVLGFGLWLVDIEGVGYDAGWIRAALGLYVAALVLGGLGGRRPKRARQVASRLAAAGEDETAALRALLDDRLSQAANYASAAAVIAILALMVFKP